MPPQKCESFVYFGTTHYSCNNIRRRRNKLIPLLKRLRPEIASRLVKIPALTFGIEIFTRAHVNEDELAPIKICLRMASRVITGGWKKSELTALCTEAGLPTAATLVKRTALQAGARLISLPEEHPLSGKLPWKRPPRNVFLRNAKSM